jgi:hypothetical protein
MLFLFWPTTSASIPQNIKTRGRILITTLAARTVAAVHVLLLVPLAYIEAGVLGRYGVLLLKLACQSIWLLARTCHHWLVAHWLTSINVRIHLHLLLRHSLVLLNRHILLLLYLLYLLRLLLLLLLLLLLNVLRLVGHSSHLLLSSLIILVGVSHRICLTLHFLVNVLLLLCLSPRSISLFSLSLLLI